MIELQIRYFASLREALGGSERLQIEAPCTVAAVRDALIARSAAHAEVLARGRAVRSSLNQQVCDESQIVSSGDELAFFPPVTGG